ncbi:MAG: class I poly(R)-hydroxyalkanoic acid synthase, partial [Hyphomicrobiales bacterium]
MAKAKKTTDNKRKTKPSKASEHLKPSIETSQQDSSQSSKTEEPIYNIKNLIDDPETFARNTAQIVEQMGKVASAYVKPIEERGNESDTADRLTDFFNTISQVGKYWTEKPERALEAQTRITSQYMELWAQSMRSFSGEESTKVVEPRSNDRRFKDAEWEENPLFDFLKQAYLITANWANDLVEDADELDDHTKLKAQFYITQLVNAVSPSNFAGTNPEVLRETLASKGENLVRGMKMLAEDMKAGDGALKIRQSSPTAFKVGENIATTPGKVIFQNEICQVIQYESTTKTVRKRPVLIVPPW